MKILFLGSSRFSLIVLKKMLEGGCNVTAVITQPDRPSGRGHKLTPTEVKKFALEKGISVLTFDRVSQHMDEIKEIDYDLAVVASFGQILPEAFLQHKLTINVHPSLLPKYRGATPIQTSLLNGDSETGVTIMKVAREVDSGDIILQKKVTIEGEYYFQLEEKLALIGGEMAIEAVKQIENGSVTFTPQNHDKAVFVQKLSKEDGIIDLTKPAEQAVRQLHALEEIGCRLMIEGQSIKILRGRVNSDHSAKPGEVLNNKKSFLVGCGEGVLEIESCLSPSGKVVTGRDFINGHSNILGVNLL